MVDWNEMARSIDSCYAVFVREISEPNEHALRIVLQEGDVSASPVAREVEGTLYENLHPIESTERSRIFELTWKSYIAYSVRKAHLAAHDKLELAVSGRLLCRYPRSRFLDYVSRSTTMVTADGGPSVHLRIIAQNHVVDVVSTDEPTIRLLQPPQ